MNVPTFGDFPNLPASRSLKYRYRESLVSEDAVDWRYLLCLLGLGEVGIWAGWVKKAFGLRDCVADQRRQSEDQRCPLASSPDGHLSPPFRGGPALLGGAFRLFQVEGIDFFRKMKSGMAQ